MIAPIHAGVGAVIGAGVIGIPDLAPAVALSIISHWPIDGLNYTPPDYIPHEIVGWYDWMVAICGTILVLLCAWFFLGPYSFICSLAGISLDWEWVARAVTFNKIKDFGWHRRMWFGWLKTMTGKRIVEMGFIILVVLYAVL